MLLLRRVAVVWLGWLLLLPLLGWVLVVWLLRGVTRARHRVALWGLLRVNRGRLRAWGGVQAVAASVLAIARSGIIVAGGVLPVKEATRHLAHAAAKLGQELQGALILRLCLLRVAIAWRLLLVTLGRLLIAGRWGVLLWISTLRLRIALRLRIIALLLCHGRRCKDDGGAPTQSEWAEKPTASGLRIHNG